MASSEGLASLSPKAYVKLQTPHKFFKVGRVFQSDSELIYVVVREGYSSSTCCELQVLGQTDNVDYNLPNIATLSLPDSPTESPRDNQYQLILECPPDEVSPLYYFDCSKWLVLSHQNLVYKIGRVDRKSIKRLEAMFAAAYTTFETITSTKPESVELGMSSLEDENEEPRYPESLPLNPPRIGTPSIEGLNEHLPVFDFALARLELKGDEATSLRTSTNLLPQFAAMAAVGRYDRGIPGYYYNLGLPMTTSPPNAASLMVSTGPPSISTPLPSHGPTLSHGDYVPQLENAELALPHTPKSLINAPTRQGKIITGHQTETDKLPPNPLWKEFKVRSSSDFKPGYMFKILWTEPLGDSTSHRRQATSNFSMTTYSQYGELAYTSIRRFIIIASHEGHSTCLPILTYGQRGVAKPGVKPDHHAIIYSTDLPPSKLGEEQELVNAPIRIEMKSRRHSLDPISRLNYAKVYTVEHHVKVSFIGRVHKDSKRTLKGDYLKINHISLHDDADDQSSRDDGALTGDNKYYY